MMEKIQKFGGAMFTPVMLFAFSGVMVGIGTLFTTQAIFGALAAPETMWYQCWNVVLQGAWTVFNQLPLLFAVSLPIGLAKKQHARCCMEALVVYLAFQYFMNTMLAQWGPVFGVDFSAEAGGSSGLTTIASIKTLDMGMISALAISGIVIALHNRFFETELPEWIGVFSGSTFVYMIGFAVMLPTALLACLVWPHVQDGIRAFQGSPAEKDEGSALSQALELPEVAVLALERLPLVHGEGVLCLLAPQVLLVRHRHLGRLVGVSVSCVLNDYFVVAVRCVLLHDVLRVPPMLV